MKALVIADDATNVIYFWHDDDFLQYLDSITDSNVSSENLSTCIQSYFAPLVVSYVNLLLKLDLSCSSVESEQENFLVVFQQSNQFIYVSLEATDSSYKERLFREMAFLKSVIGLLFGPCGHFQLQSQQISTRKKAWSKVTSVFESYIKLCADENAFLLEGVEKLHVNKEVSDACKNLIDKSIKVFVHSPAKRYLQYVMIFFHAKLLHIYSKSNLRKDLTTCSFLQIIALIFSDLCKPKPDQSTCVSTSASLHSLGMSSTSENIKSPVGSCVKQRMTDLAFVFDNTSVFSDTSSVSTCTTLTSATGKQGEKVPSQANFTSCSESADSDGARNQLYDNENCFSSEEESDSRDLTDSYEIPVYTSTRKSPFTPHVIRCASISPSVKIVLMSKVEHSGLSSLICGTLYWVRKLQFFDGKVEGATTSTLNKLNDCFKLLYMKSLKLKGKKRAKCLELYNVWSENGQKLLTSVIEANANEQLLQLEHCVKKLETKAHSLFGELFPSLLQHTSKSDLELKGVIDLPKIQRYAESKLSGYMDFLLTKSQQNIPMTIYSNSFPGMVHFAFLQRSRSVNVSHSSNMFEDELTTTSLSSSDFTTVNHTFPTLKKQFWNNVYHVHSQALLQKNIDLYEDDRFRFTSYMWSANKPPKLPSPSKLQQALVTRKYSSHTALTVFNKDFYEKYILSYHDTTEDVFVFQLFCVHFAVVPHETITNQSEQLLQLLLKN